MTNKLTLTFKIGRVSFLNVIFTIKVPVCIHIQVYVMWHHTITTDRDKKVSLFRFLGVCFCSQCVCVCIYKCVCVEADMCAVMHGPFFLCAGHQIISQSPGLMVRGEWWELYLPAENARGGGWMMCSDAGWAAFCLAWPPNTWDQGHGSTASHSWYRPHCYKEHMHIELLPQLKCWQWWQRKKKLLVCVLLSIASAERLIVLNSVYIHSGHQLACDILTN